MPFEPINKFLIDAPVEISELHLAFEQNLFKALALKLNTPTTSVEELVSILNHKKEILNLRLDKTKR